MPDDNKFEKLREIGYSIPGLCGECIHGKFSRSIWGTCSLNTYEHRKHDNPDRGRGVSIVTTGTCSSFSVDHGKLASQGLGAHMEFFNGGRAGPDPANGS